MASGPSAFQILTGLQGAGPVGGAGGERAEDGQEEGGIAQPDASRHQAREQIDQDCNSQQCNCVVIGYRMKIDSLEIV